MVAGSLVFPEGFKELVSSCLSFCEKNMEKMSSGSVREKRRKLSSFVEGFHKDCGTLTPSVAERIEDLRNGTGLVLMTAHQPNLFAYSGVLRKATLSFVLARKLEEILEVPVVSFFGIADQDFTDDRWVKSALLPDVERRGGVLELRLDLPEKLLLNKVAKPSRQILNEWRTEIEKWFNCKLGSIERFCKSFGLEFDRNCNRLAENFEEFWKLVVDAHDRALVFSDFNAYVMSKVINQTWGYDTLFSRFSECQQIFEDEFCFLLSHFKRYSKYTKEAIVNMSNPQEGIYEREYDTVPFWYHCDCGSKARLTAKHQDGSLIGCGECLHCKREYEIKFGSDSEYSLSGIVSRVSARSLSMPLIFFDGLKVGCYVGGIGGKEYLHQASLVAGNMGMHFPPIVIWRPKDVYSGVGQLDALMMFRRLSSSFDFSQLPAVKAALKDKIIHIQEHIDRLELCKKELAKSIHAKREDVIERMKALSSEQNETRKEADFSLMVRDLKLLENIEAVMSLDSCVVDYAVNVGLKATSEQWIAFLQENGSFSSNVALKTGFEELARA